MWICAECVLVYGSRSTSLTPRCVCLASGGCRLKEFSSDPGLISGLSKLMENIMKEKGSWVILQNR